MTDPRRWRDDPEVSDEVRAALSGGSGARGLDHATQSRVGARLGRLGAAPVSVAAWFSVKTAAALGVAGGVAAAGGLAVADHYHFLQRTQTTGTSGAQVPRAPGPHATSPRDANEFRTSEPPPASVEPEVAPPADAPVPLLNPSSDLPRVPRAPAASTPPPSASARLADETALLERARRALVSAPAAALTLVGEHAQRFPDGQLAAERRLLEVDALYRVGRRSEARVLAQRLLASGASGLYAERVARLLEKIDQGSQAP